MSGELVNTGKILIYQKQLFGNSEQFKLRELDR